MSGLDHEADRAAAVATAQQDAAFEKKAMDDAHSVSSVSHDAYVPDGIHDGLTFPTKDERATLRRVSDRIPWNAYCRSRLLLRSGRG